MLRVSGRGAGGLMVPCSGRLRGGATHQAARTGGKLEKALVFYFIKEKNILQVSLLVNIKTDLASLPGNSYWP